MAEPQEQRAAPPPWGTTWQETVAYVRAGGRFPQAEPDDSDGERTVLVGATRPHTTEVLVLYFAESHEMSDEEHQDPERVLAMLSRAGCDCVWDPDQRRAVPRDPHWSPWTVLNQRDEEPGGE